MNKKTQLLSTKMKLFLKERNITPDFLVDVSKNKSKNEIERITIFSNHPEIQYSGWSFHKGDLHPLSIVTKLLEILLERLDLMIIGYVYKRKEDFRHHKTRILKLLVTLQTFENYDYCKEELECDIIRLCHTTLFEIRSSATNDIREFIRTTIVATRQLFRIKIQNKEQFLNYVTRYEDFRQNLLRNYEDMKLFVEIMLFAKTLPYYNDKMPFERILRVSLNKAYLYMTAFKVKNNKFLSPYTFNDCCLYNNWH